jgi:hypothetical protein
VIKSRKLRWVGHYVVWGTGEVHPGLWWGDVREGDHLEDLGVEGRLILKWIFKQWGGMGRMDWIHLEQNRDRWQALVNAVTNIRVP